MNLNKRPGDTKITSVSVSKTFWDLVKKNNISPTEAFRRGVAVILCERGIDEYNTERNLERLRKSNDFLEVLRKTEFARENLVKLKELLEELNNI